MTPTVAGKHALITGASSGINLAFARLLLEKGCSVMIGDLQLSDEAKGLLGEYPHPGAQGRPSALFHKVDVASWPELSALWSASLEAFSKIDIVVPGAGVLGPPTSNFWEPPVTETNPDSRSRDSADANPGHYAVLDINLTAPIRMSQLAIGYWTQAKRDGCLLYVGSVAGHVSQPIAPLYCASKYGLHGFVRSLRSLRDQFGIRVSCVAPCYVQVCSCPHQKTHSLETTRAMQRRLSHRNQTQIWSPGAAMWNAHLENCVWTPMDEVVEGMLELVVNEQYGDGTILEISKGHRRIVPDVEPPRVAGPSRSGSSTLIRNLFEGLKNRGLRV
ncbi:hypothetical protein HIM_08058 [Hirsutella minnesotensis 3608]|uniref:NAD(P)-binding protein n=1 Tax=Hirsutella minnesotensis 3608 TaxID=1043627 RepID=A0A0F8A3W4_9HYPO|nr:hypothetical protein HIM_08058 [Hirsutella minnesotensis 3608]